MPEKPESHTTAIGPAELQLLKELHDLYVRLGGKPGLGDGDPEHRFVVQCIAIMGIPAFVPESGFEQLMREAALQSDQPKTTRCGCWRCLSERGERRTVMILCPDCGNKRCPRASDHRLACAHSNEPGQIGSVYAR